MMDDPTGPEMPEEEMPVKDGEPAQNGSGSIRDAAEEPDFEEGRQLPEPPPIPGDKQLTLGGLGRTRNIQAEVSLMSASVPAEGLIDPNAEGELIVHYIPQKYEYVPKRDPEGVITGWKLRMQLRPVWVTTPDGAETYKAELEEAFDE